MLSLSVKPEGEIYEAVIRFLPEEWDFANYVEAFEFGEVGTFVVNGLCVTLSILAIQMFTVIPAAYVLARKHFKLEGIVFGMVLTGLIVPQQAVVIPLVLAMSKLGMLNTFPALVLPFMTSALGIFLLRQSFKAIFSRQTGIRLLHSGHKIVGSGGLGKNFPHSRQVFDFEFHSFFLCGATMPSDIEYGAGIEFVGGRRKLSIDRCTRGKLKMTHMGFRRSPVSIIYLLADQNARTGEIRRSAMAELEGDSRIICRCAECNLVFLSGREVGHCISESLPEPFHHTAIYRPLHKGGHPLGHRHLMVASTSKVVVGDTCSHRFSHLLKITVKLRYIHLEEWFLHRNEGICAFHNIACIVHHVLSIVHMQAETIKIVDFHFSDGLFIAKGFTDCVVNLEGSKANVTVMTESDALTAEEVTRIRDALLSQCKGLTAQDITIVEVK